MLEAAWGRDRRSRGEPVGAAVVGWVEQGTAEAVWLAFDEGAELQGGRVVDVADDWRGGFPHRFAGPFLPDFFGRRGVIGFAVKADRDDAGIEKAISGLAV